MDVDVDEAVDECGVHMCMTVEVDAGVAMHVDVDMNVYGCG